MRGRGGRGRGLEKEDDEMPTRRGDRGIRGNFRGQRHDIEPVHRGGRGQRFNDIEMGRGGHRGGRYFNDDTDIERGMRGDRGGYGRPRRGGYHQHFDDRFEDETHPRRG